MTDNNAPDPTPDPVVITHLDGRTATVSPKVAAFLMAQEGWVLAPKPTRAKGKAAPTDPED
jgi:hypothetical protein